MERPLTLKRISENISTGTLTEDQLESALLLVKTAKPSLTEIQSFINQLASYLAFTKYGISNFLRLGILNCLCGVLEITLEKSFKFDLSEIVAADVFEGEAKKENFVLSQVETCLVPLLSVIDDSKKTDTATVKAILRLSSVVMHKKVLRYPLNLIKIILCSTKPISEDVEVLSLLFQFFAKFNTSSKYFALKGGIKVVAHCLKVPRYQNTSAAIFAVAALGTAAGSGNGQSDSTNIKVELWLTGVFDHIIRKLLPDAAANTKVFAHISSVEYILYLLWMALRKCEVTDLQQGILGLGILKTLKNILDYYEGKSIQVVALAIAVLRRLVSLESLDTIDKLLAEKVPIWAKLIPNKDSPTNLYHKFLAKEMLACIGNVVANKVSTFIFLINQKVKSDCHLGNLIIGSCSQFVADTPKVVKTGLSTLINLASYDEIYVDCELVYKFIEEVLKVSKKDTLVIEFAFRLLLMISAKGDNLQIMVGNGIKKIALEGLTNSTMSKEGSIAIIQILRMIYGKRKEEWIKDMSETKKILLEVIKKNNLHVNLCCEAFLLLSFLVDTEDTEYNKQVSIIISDLTSQYKDKEADLNKLVKSISHLPIEEILPGK